MGCDLQNDVFILLKRCPCYCGGEGVLILATCPVCGTVIGRCDEVDTLIRDLQNPVYGPEQSLCHPGVTLRQFRAATEAELQLAGLTRAQYRRWR
jgi:hypothetical protein